MLELILIVSLREVVYNGLIILIFFLGKFFNIYLVYWVFKGKKRNK